MKIVLLTSETFVKDLTPMSDNLSGKYLLPALQEAQEIGLRSILGDRLLDKLKELVSSNQLPDDSPYKELLDKIQYYLAYQALVSVIMNTSFKIHNFGLNQSSDENLTNPSYTDTIRICKYYQDKADYYCLLLQQYLLREKASFPELSTQDCKRINSHLRSSFTSGLWLGGARAYELVPLHIND